MTLAKFLCWIASRPPVSVDAINAAEAARQLANSPECPQSRPCIVSVVFADDVRLFMANCDGKEIDRVD